MGSSEARGLGTSLGVVLLLVAGAGAQDAGRHATTVRAQEAGLAGGQRPEPPVLQRPDPRLAPAPVQLDGADLRRRMDLGRAGEVLTIRPEGVRRVEDSAQLLRFDPGDLVLERRDGRPTLRIEGDRKVYRLPVALSEFRGAGPRGERWSSLAVDVSVERHLQYSPEADAFEGAIAVTLLELPDGGAARDLESVVQVSVRAPALRSVDPGRLEVRRVNVRSDSIVVTAGEWRGEDAVVEVSALGEDVRPDWESVPLPFEAAWFEVSVDPATIQGFGLGVATVRASVAASMSDGELRLSVSSTDGSIDDVLVLDPATGAGTARLRSAGLDGATVTVVHPVLGEHTVEVDFTPPIAFLVAALLGGALGGVALRLKAEQRTGLAAGAALGALLGLISAVAYAAGVRLVDVDVGEHFSEGAVFTVAALTALGREKLGGG